jgi:hypothetical protein
MALKPIAPAASTFPSHQTGAAHGSGVAPVSTTRIEANRANAQFSTGPRTPEGKARSSQNAFKHGLFSNALGLAARPLNEDRAEFEALRDGLWRDHCPAGADEEAIVDRMAALWWELARVHRLGQMHLRTRLDQGVLPFVVMKELAVFGAEQSRLERSLTRQRKDLWLLQGRHQGVVDRAGRKAAAAYERLIAAQDAEAAASRARTDASAPSGLAERPVAAPPIAPPTAPHLRPAAPSAPAERRNGEPSAVRRPYVGSIPEFRPEFLDETPPQGPTNGSGRVAGSLSGSGD